MYPDLQNLAASVQKNCHISDALYAGEDTLCIYLLKMREYYRWETQRSFHAPLNNQDIGNWLRRREKLWEQLESEEFAKLPVEDHLFEPFESERINRVLLDYGLVYSGGLGQRSKPHFFLGMLRNQKQFNGYTVLIADREYARDLSAPAAMTQGKTIYIRRESLQRILWEKIEQWRWNEPDNAMKRVLTYYDFEQHPQAALDTMTDNELESMLLHEIGEIQAGEILGESWELLLFNAPRSKMEIMLRAVRDHLADALSTLPRLLERENEASLHFYFANLNYLRRDLYPALYQAYDRWRKTRDLDVLAAQVEQGKIHWQGLCEEIVTMASAAEAVPAEPIVSLIDQNRL